MMDPELDAMYKCTEVLKDIDDEAKMRVLQYVISRFKLVPQHNSFATPANNFAGSQSGSDAPRQIPPYSNPSDPNNFGIQNNNSNALAYPTLRDLYTKDLPTGEVEWILVYCFYASDFGEKEFTREDLAHLYETSKRKTETTVKNLSQNINSAIKKDWIKSLNDKEYIILTEGLKYVKDILQGNSIGRTRKPSKRKAKENTTES